MCNITGSVLQWFGGEGAELMNQKSKAEELMRPKTPRHKTGRCRLEKSLG